MRLNWWTTPCVAMCMTTIACVDESTPDDEQLSDVEQLVLGDIQCASSFQTDWAYADCDLPAGDWCVYSTSQTIGPAYGNDWNSGEDCQPYMNVHHPYGNYVPANYPMTIDYYATSAYKPSTQSECENFRIELAVYYFDQNGDASHLAGLASEGAHWIGNECKITTVPHVRHTLTCSGNQCQVDPVIAARAYVKRFFWSPIVKDVITIAARDI